VAPVGDVPFVVGFDQDGAGQPHPASGMGKTPTSGRRSCGRRPAPSPRSPWGPRRGRCAGSGPCRLPPSTSRPGRPASLGMAGRRATGVVGGLVVFPFRRSETGALRLCGVWADRRRRRSSSARARASSALAKICVCRGHVDVQAYGYGIFTHDTLHPGACQTRKPGATRTPTPDRSWVSGRRRGGRAGRCVGHRPGRCARSPVAAGARRGSRGARRRWRCRAPAPASRTGPARSRMLHVRTVDQARAHSTDRADHRPRRGRVHVRIRDGPFNASPRAAKSSSSLAPAPPGPHREQPSRRPATRRPRPSVSGPVIDDDSGSRGLLGVHGRPHLRDVLPPLGQ